MESKNQYLKNYLNYYCSLKNAPEYAVLVKGSWGSGKTKFIKNYFQEADENEHFYISLYGVTSFEDIENEFFKLLNPLLASKWMKLIGKIVKVSLKAATKVDIDGDGESDGTLNISIPNENLLNALNNSTKGKILVFDDIERCSIKINDLLGYINKFVEHEGFKVILIANEEEIIETQKDNESTEIEYKRIKEKLVGKTFEIEPEVELSLSHFVSQLKSIDIINEHISLITQLFYSSTYNNLRILRRTLFDFDRLFSEFPKEITKNKPFVSQFLSLYIVYSFEILSGNIIPKDINDLTQVSGLLLVNGLEKAKQSNEYRNIDLKYNGINLYDTIFKVDIWQHLFEVGFISSSTIVDAVKNSYYFLSDDQADWIRLNNGQYLSDSEFKEVLDRVVSDWKQKNFKTINEIKHVADILIWLSNNELYKEKKEQILSFSIDYVDELNQQGELLKQFVNNKYSRFNHERFDSINFRSIKDDTFIKIKKYITEKTNEAIHENYPNDAKELLKLMIEDTKEFCISLSSPTSYNNKIYYNIPILSYMEPTEFVSNYFKLITHDRECVAYAFEERYRDSNNNMKLQNEIEFLKKIIGLMEEEKNKRRGNLSSYSTGIMIDTYFRKALSNLEEKR